MKKEVLGVKIDDISLAEVVATVEKWIHDGGKHFIVTPNPEFLVKAQKDEEFKDILNGADLAIPDGIGLKFAGVKNRVSGVDLMEKLIAVSAKNGFVVSFLGGREGVAERMVERLRRLYQNISVAFASDGGFVDNNGNSNTKYKIPNTDILFVAFGPPKQEKWIAKNLKNLPVNVVMGVGGAFDYLSGRTPRATVWMRNIGLEWLFRLINEPWRIKRQLALIKYLWLLTLQRLKG